MKHVELLACALALASCAPSAPQMTPTETAFNHAHDVVFSKASPKQKCAATKAAVDAPFESYELYQHDRWAKVAIVYCPPGTFPDEPSDAERNASLAKAREQAMSFAKLPPDDSQACYSADLAFGYFKDAMDVAGYEKWREITRSTCAKQGRRVISGLM